MIKSYIRGTAKRLSENFISSEFMCKGSGCCNVGMIDEKLVEILQKIRDHFDKPVIINSGYRCQIHNKSVGGSTGSYHTYGQAADIVVEDVTPAEVARYAESIGVNGIGLYETAVDGHFVHIDTRAKKSFWFGQNQQPRDTFGGSVENVVENVESCCKMNLPVLSGGSTGTAVKSMQLLLIHTGYNCGGKGADGLFGEKTADALKRFQSSYGLTPDGICGVKTWSKLLGI